MGARPDSMEKTHVGRVLFEAEKRLTEGEMKII